jgi:sugar phosphate permease
MPSLLPSSYRRADSIPARPPHEQRRRWVVLSIGLGAQSASSMFLYGLPAVAPTLRAPGEVTRAGLSLGQAGVIVAAPSVGLLLALIAWGAIADRFGERVVIAAGMAVATLALALATTVHGLLPLGLLLVAAGVGGASVSAASGRMILGWFSARERGLAMGIRQTGQPLGVALAAAILPPVSSRWGLTGVFTVMAVLAGIAVVATALLAADPPRPVRVAGAAPARSPYRDGVLWRVHASSAALVVPQFVVSVFTLAYLVSERDWSPVAAGRVIVVFQVAGAAGRIVAGVWSDRVNSRLRPMRLLAVASAALMLALAVGDLTHSVIIVAVFGLAAVVTVADNGLAFTAVAERAGPGWAGRALGVQNTGQNVAAALTPPLLGSLIAGLGYDAGFVVAAIFPVIAIGLIPVRRAARSPGDELSAA